MPLAGEAELMRSAGRGASPSLGDSGTARRALAEFTLSQVTTSFGRVGTMSEWMSGTDASSPDRRVGFGGPNPFECSIEARSRVAGFGHRAVGSRERGTRDG